MRTSSTTKLLSLLSLAPSLTSAAYTLTEDYSQQTFFGNFTAFAAKDPTNGFVSYQTYAAGTSKSLIHTIPNAADASYISVDPSTSLGGAGGASGRASMRISSNKSFNKGLFIVDLLHMPKNTCGSWPAFWLLGPDWPNGGEIDIIEGVNAQEGNQMTLHTSAGCSVQAAGGGGGGGAAFAGKLENPNCGPDEANTGCAILGQDQRGFGDGFNRANGGVYATEWTSQGISVWFFPREGIPADVGAGTPNPAGWGRPAAKFAGSRCNIDQHFRDMKIVFNTAFCGDWAGKVWVSGGCAKSTGVATCEEYVGKHPEAFKESFWLVNYVRVFQQQGAQRLLKKVKRSREIEDVEIVSSGIDDSEVLGA